MKASRLKPIIGGVLVSGLAVLWWSFSEGRTEIDANATRNRSTLAKHEASPSRSRQAPGTTPKQAKPENPVLNKTLEDLARRWDETAKRARGEALLPKQRELAKEAVAKLGGSDELLQFLNFLSEKGAGDMREWIIREGVAELFSGANAKQARGWLATVEERKLREQLCYVAGQNFSGLGLKEFISSFHPDDHCESAVLTGYCCAQAKNDPGGAVKSFLELRPPNVDMSGLAQIMAVLPPTAEFAKLSSTLPDDSKTLARNARTALLQSWASAKPEDAAQYVIANSKLAFPEQMGIVTQIWAKTSPDAASAWIEALSPGKPRDEGTAGLARHLSAADPVRAWDCASKVGDFNKRVETATAVFKEWEKTDREAATKAWVALFPGK